MKAIVLSCLVLGGCASTEYVASRSNWDVCRLSMGGPHAQAADAEAARRGLDCRPLYPAIQGQLANEGAAVRGYLQATQPAPAQTPRTCQTYRVGNSLETRCF